jgi:hypothetical protein
MLTPPPAFFIRSTGGDGVNANDDLVSNAAAVAAHNNLVVMMYEGCCCRLLPAVAVGPAIWFECVALAIPPLKNTLSMTLFTTIATLLLSVLTALATTGMIEAFVSSSAASQLFLSESSSTMIITPVSGRRQSTMLRSTSSLDKDRIKKAGAGITTKAPGNNCIYDPNVDAKLQGTDNLNDRITSGAAYGGPPPSSSSSKNAVDIMPSSSSSSSSPPTTTSTSKEVATENKLNMFTTNLTKLLNGELDTRFKNRSQY